MIQLASAGAAAYISLSLAENLPQVVLDLKRALYRIVSLDMKGETPVKNMHILPPLTLIVGGEDSGIDERLLRLSDYVVKIPVFDEKFSLNLSVSAAIMMHHLSD